MIKFFSNIYSLKQKIGRIFSIITIKDTSNPQGLFKMSLFNLQLCPWIGGVDAEGLMFTFTVQNYFPQTFINVV